jgi:membrane protein YqaA with SNARE-associated domain
MVIIALVAGVLWFVSSRTDRGVTSVLQNPQLWVLVVAVSVLGTLGNLGLYFLGGRGAEGVFARFPYFEGERWERIGGYYRRWGGKILIFSAIPMLGTLLPVAAGAYGVKRKVFLLWVFYQQSAAQLAAPVALLPGFSICVRNDSFQLSRRTYRKKERSGETSMMIGGRSHVA